SRTKIRLAEDSSLHSHWPGAWPVTQATNPFSPRPPERVTRTRIGVEASVDQSFEEELVTKAKIGDPSAPPFLVSLYGEKLLGFARAHAPDLTDADRESIVETAI